MSLTLAPVQEWATQRQLELDGLMLQLHVVPEFTRVKMSLNNQECDEYTFKVDRVVFLRDQQEVAVLTREDTLAYEALIRGLKEANQWSRVEVVEKGDIPQPQPASSLDWNRLSRVVDLEESFFDALMKNDEGRLAELGFERFKLSKAFEDTPCDKAFYTDLHAEYVQSRYVSGLVFSDYYNWYHRSKAQHVGPDGQLSSATREQLPVLLEAWKNMEPDQARYWLHRNLSVHPRHLALLAAAIEQFHAGNATQVSPSPVTEVTAESKKVSVASGRSRRP